MKHIVIAAVAAAMAAVVGCSDSEPTAKSELEKAGTELKAAADKAAADLDKQFKAAGAELDKAAKDVDKQLQDAAKSLEGLDK